MNKPTEKQAARGRWIGIVSLFTAIVLVAYIKLRPPDMEKEATQLLDAITAADTGRIYAFSFPGEIQAAGLDRRSFDEFWRGLVAPRLSKFRFSGSPTTQLLARGDEGAAARTGFDSGGNRYELQAMVWKSEDGVRSEVLGYLLTAWVLEYGVAKGKAISPEVMLTSRLEGLRHDRPALERLGMKGVFNLDRIHGEQKLVTWEELERGAREHLAELSQMPAG